jgi:polysaccharide export outer membrane protein
VPSGNIIGYQPIPNSALDAANLGHATPAPSAARPAYPGAAGVAAGGNFSYGQTAPLQPQGAAGPGPQPGLPASYLTGIVGEGFYTLGRDDVIHIDVRNQPEFSGAFAVGFDGKIQYNYLGDIPIAGLTKYEVQQVLEKMLSRYVRVPQVNVTIIGYNSKVVYVIGEVNSPGKFIMRGDAIKLREALLAAGLPTDDAALGRVHVIKPDLDRPKVKVINVKRILYAGKLKDDLELYSGEIIVVPSTVLSKVNNFLGRLLSPAAKVTRAAAYAY